MHDNANTDQHWAARVAKGDERAFRYLFDKYADRMYVNALRFTKSPELAADLTQEIFVRIWVNREKLAVVRAFDAYLFTVARNLIRNEMKKSVLAVENADFLEAYFRDSAPGPAEALQYKELEATVREAVEALPPQLRTVFLLSRREGLTHEQIAERMNISVVTSKTYMVRCLLAIRERLGNNAARLGLLLYLLGRF